MNRREFIYTGLFGLGGLVVGCTSPAKEKVAKNTTEEVAKTLKQEPKEEAKKIVILPDKVPFKLNEQGLQKYGDSQELPYHIRSHDNFYLLLYHDTRNPDYINQQLMRIADILSVMGCVSGTEITVRIEGAQVQDEKESISTLKHTSGFIQGYSAIFNSLKERYPLIKFNGCDNRGLYARPDYKELFAIRDQKLGQRVPAFQHTQESIQHIIERQEFIEQPNNPLSNDEKKKFSKLKDYLTHIENNTQGAVPQGKLVVTIVGGGHVTMANKEHASYISLTPDADHITGFGRMAAFTKFVQSF